MQIETNPQLLETAACLGGPRPGALMPAGVAIARPEAVQGEFNPTAGSGSFLICAVTAGRREPSEAAHPVCTASPALGTSKQEMLTADAVSTSTSFSCLAGWWALSGRRSSLVPCPWRWPSHSKGHTKAFGDPAAHRVAGTGTPPATTVSGSTQEQKLVSSEVLHG